MTAALQALADLRETWAASLSPLPDDPPRPERWHGVLVSLGEQRLLFSQAELDAVIPCPPVSPIPGTRDFVLGIASWQGVLMPVLSGERLCEQALGSGAGRAHALVLRRRGFHFALTVSALRGPVVLPASDYCETTVADVPCAAWCRGGFDLPDQWVPVVSVDRLLEDPRLTDTALTRTNTKDMLS